LYWKCDDIKPPCRLLTAVDTTVELLKNGRQNFLPTPLFYQTGFPKIQKPNSLSINIESIVHDFAKSRNRKNLAKKKFFKKFVIDFIGKDFRKWSDQRRFSFFFGDAMTPLFHGKGATKE
tara:strand:+ start:600 stop:959 length:360 start_codon:yes stop_codon:yes gene_type:complete